MLMDIIMIIVGFICLMILQREVHKQELQEAYEKGYRKGLYTAVIKASSKTD